MRQIIEYGAFEGSEMMIIRVGADGNRTVINQGVCLYMRKWTIRRNLSGTAIIRNYYRLKHSLGRFFFSHGT